MTTLALPKVAICFPSGDMVHADFALALAGLCSASAPLDTPIINNKSSIVAIARNNAIAMARDFAVDYVLFLDSDMVFPRDTLHRLLLHRKDIIGATYTKRVPPYTILGRHLDDTASPDERGLIEMRHIPTGCLLIRLAVFEALSKPYFRFLHDEASGEIWGEDYVFCDRARAAGFRIWCDTLLSLEIGHIGQRIFRPTPEKISFDRS
jgi:glycosyltransferase involved in cell wall biosynthesis